MKNDCQNYVKKVSRLMQGHPSFYELKKIILGIVRGQN